MIEPTITGFAEASLLLKENQRKGPIMLALRRDFWETATAEELDYAEKIGLRNQHGRKVAAKRKIAKRRKEIA